MIHCFVLATLLLASVSWGQDSTPRQNPIEQSAATAAHTESRAKLCALPGIPAQRVQEVVDASSALQPPLAADAMIRIAEKISGSCPLLAKDLLPRAFDLAETVTPETAYEVGSGMSLSTDSRIFQSREAYLLQEDRLSLRSRAVLAMAQFDSSLAIDLFQRIGHPRPVASDCANPMVPDVAVYYKALGKILPLLKARKPRKDQDPYALFTELQGVISATTSSVQLLPLANLLTNAAENLSHADLVSLLNSLAAAIDNLPVDDNAFYWREQYPSVKAYDQLAALARSKQVPPYTLARAIHNFLNRSLNGPHCEGNGTKDLKQLIKVYESLDRSTRTSDPAESLSVPNSEPTVERAPDAGEYWVSPKAAQLLLDAKHLNFDDDWNRYTEADRSTPEWRDRVERLLNHIEDWHPSDEANPADYLHERCILLHSALAYLPPGSLYNKMVSVCLDTLAESTLQWDNPEEWDLEVHHFLDFAREDVLDFAPTDEKQPTKDERQPTPAAAIAALKNSPNAYLHARGVVVEFLDSSISRQQQKGGQVGRPLN